MSAERRLPRAERERLALKVVCPKCHSTAGRKCMKRRTAIRNTGLVMPGSPMKSVHAERLALTPEYRSVPAKAPAFPPVTVVTSVKKDEVHGRPFLITLEDTLEHRTVAVPATGEDLKAMSDVLWTALLGER